MTTWIIAVLLAAVLIEAAIIDWALHEKEQVGKRNVTLLSEKNALTRENSSLKTVLAQMIAERDQAIVERKAAQRELEEALKSKPARTPRSNSKAKTAE